MYLNKSITSVGVGSAEEDPCAASAEEDPFEDSAEEKAYYKITYTMHHIRNEILKHDVSDLQQKYTIERLIGEEVSA